MKLRNKILAMAVVAVAGVNVYLANDIQVQKNSLSLLNLENIANADETPEGCGQSTSIDVDKDGNGRISVTITSDGSSISGYCNDETEQSCAISYRGATFSGYPGIFTMN